MNSQPTPERLKCECKHYWVDHKDDAQLACAECRWEAWQPNPQTPPVPSREDAGLRGEGRSHCCNAEIYIDGIEHEGGADTWNSCLKCGKECAVVPPPLADTVGGEEYRKKPVIVRALLVQPQYRNLDEIISFVGRDNLCPIERRPDYVLKIKTLEGDHAVGFGDYIIRGVKGEFYPCKPDIFDMTYEPVSTPPSKQGEEKCPKCQGEVRESEDKRYHLPYKKYCVENCGHEYASTINSGMSTPPKAEGVGEWEEEMRKAAYPKSKMLHLDEAIRIAKCALTSAIRAAEERKDGEWKKRIESALSRLHKSHEALLQKSPTTLTKQERPVVEWSMETFDKFIRTILLPPPPDKPTQP